MTNVVKFANNDSTTLAASITGSQTTLVVVSGTGSEFPTLTTGQFFPVTLISAANSATQEIAYCTSISGDTLTVTRGQEGTSGTAFNAGDTVANLLTAGALSVFPQLGTGNTWSGSNTFSATGTFSAGVTSNGFDSGGAQFRAVSGNYGLMIQNNGAVAYLLASNSGTPYGSYSTLRPFYFNLSTGAVNIDGTGAGVSLGGALSVAGTLSVSNAATLSGGITTTGLVVTGTALIEETANLQGGAIITDGNAFSSATSEVPNEYWVQGAIGNARTTLFPHGAYTFLGNGNFTVPANVYYIEATVIGGGGGGASCDSNGTINVSGAGGGAGGVAIGWIAVTPGQVIAATVGGGGGAGSAGGTSSFSTLSATGGLGASFQNSGTTSAGAGPGTGSGGYIQMPGGDGTDGQSNGTFWPGNGGASYLGGGGRGGSKGGVAGAAYGSGGGGAYDLSNSGTPFAGGAGATGCVILRW